MSAIHGAVHKTGGAVKPQGEENEDPRWVTPQFIGLLSSSVLLWPNASDRYKNIDSKMVEMVKNEIMDQGDPVEWDDIAGLTFAKKTVIKIFHCPFYIP